MGRDTTRNNRNNTWETNSHRNKQERERGNNNRNDYKPTSVCGSNVGVLVHLPIKDNRVINRVNSNGKSGELPRNNRDERRHETRRKVDRGLRQCRRIDNEKTCQTDVHGNGGDVRRSNYHNNRTRRSANATTRKQKKEKEKQGIRESKRQEIWEETKKKRREEPKEIKTKEITAEMITEVRKTIGSERKVSIDWVKKITLYSEEAIIEIAIKELGMRKENGTLILKE